MAQQFNDKKVILSEILEDLNNGLTKWKKDDIGFGSIEKKYSLTLPEMITLMAHPKIKDVESRIPNFVIVDDLEDLVDVEEPVQETKIEIKTPAYVQQPQTRVQIQEKSEVKYEAFI